MTKENKKKVTISLTPKSHEKIKRYAKKKHTSVSGAIEDWIWNELQEIKEDMKN
ncbi:MAG: hypothetical protein KIB08_06470 [Negativicoccus succinicivorans]|uniref:DUF6364 family protein n=1 Tax=Negativicoccus succinicivorans TaxID=620903 RepID=UPI0026F294CD|nr:DUF6364 family protein [Negativicoccus succinicivorans]MBS5888133.1 hypothetical protein [Negativicoccus succinicivorans]MDU3214527.1 DUF6364 family protein [Negativicoccus succinicivorans]